MTTTIPFAEVDAIMERYGDIPAGAYTVDRVRERAATLRWYAENPSPGVQPEQNRAEAHDLDALADRYEREAR